MAPVGGEPGILAGRRHQRVVGMCGGDARPWPSRYGITRGNKVVLPAPLHPEANHFHHAPEAQTPSCEEPPGRECADEKRRSDQSFSVALDCFAALCRMFFASRISFILQDALYRLTQLVMPQPADDEGSPRS